MLIGSDESNYKAVEAAIGRKVDIIRAYRFKGQNHQSLAALAAADYIVQASYKFRDGNGTVASTAVTAHQLDADLDIFDTVMENLKRSSKGEHSKGYEHEEDAKAAAASGTPTQLNAAVTYCIDRRKTQARAAGLRTFQCWTGWDLLTREPLYRVSGQDVDDIMLDPYELSTSGAWVSLVASYGQDFNYASKIYPNARILIGEINAPNTAGAGQQASWLNQARHDLEANYPKLWSACLWQGGNLSETPAELALMKNGFFAPSAPPAPLTQSVSIAAIKALGTARSNFKTAYANNVTSANELDAAAVELDTAMGDVLGT